MRAVVTGAAGFIGSHLCERLISGGHTVLGIDDFSTGREKNLSKVLGHPNFFFKNMDITEDHLPPHFYDADWVFHLAAKADIVPSIMDPQGYHRVNVTGTLKVLEAAREAKVKRFIYAASASCYGITEDFTSEKAPLDPQYPYALTKALGEEYVMKWCSYYKMSATSLRLFNVYGPRSRTSGAYGAVMGTFLTQLYHGKPFTVVGNGNQLRDFVFVDDVVDAFVMAAKESILSSTRINIGSGLPHSINQLLEYIKPGHKEITYLPWRPAEPKVTCADISNARILLGWYPKTLFHTGVSKMLEHIEDFKDAPLWDKESISKATELWFKYLGDA